MPMKKPWGGRDGRDRQRRQREGREGLGRVWYGTFPGPRGGSSRGSSAGGGERCLAPPDIPSLVLGQRRGSWGLRVRHQTHEY